MVIIKPISTPASCHYHELLSWVNDFYYININFSSLMLETLSFLSSSYLNAMVQS